MRFDVISHPVFSCDEAKAFEAKLFGDDEEKAWRAMVAAGTAVGESILLDWRELTAWPTQARLLVLVGKGHNGGDALLAAKKILETKTDATAEVCLLFSETELRPLTTRAWRELTHAASNRVSRVAWRDLPQRCYRICVDGVFGFQFRAPLAENFHAPFQAIENCAVQMRAAVDLPSGLGDAHALRADFTYATGSLKRPVLAVENRERVGRIRYLDTGFFSGVQATSAAGERVISGRTLDALRGWRAPQSDKRDYGHLFVMVGSRNTPGAALMNVRAALEAGVGLLTAFVPESLVPPFAAAVPEAMWVGCPETPDGGIALESVHLVRERASRADALAIGSGLGREKETLALVSEVLEAIDRPAVLDADALQPEIVTRGKGQKILTPHAGEFKRLAGETPLLDYARKTSTVTVLKGSATRISEGVAEYISVAGGPVLARGGSGDMLCGMIGALLAQEPTNPLGAAAVGVEWHGRAADAWARDRGQTATHTTELLNYLGTVLRDPTLP